VLASSLLLTITGMAALSAVRVQMRSARLARDSLQARACATAAVELGLLRIGQDPNWRDAWSSGIWINNKPMDSGQFTLEGIDPQDNILDDSEYEPLVLTGTGVKGLARHKTQVTLVPVIEPLEAMNTCIHGSGLIHIKAGKRITALGAPVSTNGQLNNDGVLDGDAQAQSINHTGTITGTLTVPIPAKRMPDAALIATYISKATPVPYISTIDKMVLAPGCNPWGPTDPNGLYYINTGGNDLQIQDSRIHGTLVVRLGSGFLTLDNVVFLHPYRSDFPALLVDGNLRLKCESAYKLLSEQACSTNFNPLGAPYNGLWDSDTYDEYPNEIRGLIHVTGNLILEQSARIVGTIICEGTATCEGTNTIIHDPGLYACPPNGYTFVDGMAISPGSWKQVVD
jgi:hypothetical protein